MRYFSYSEPEDIDSIFVGMDTIVTLSEDDIRATYWPYWYDRMCNKFGKEVVDKQYSFDDCLTDWLIVNWAWEIIGDRNGET